MATANQYHPWTETGETELDYFRRRFLEESARVERLEWASTNLLHAGSNLTDETGNPGAWIGAALCWRAVTDGAAAPPAAPLETPQLPAEVQAIAYETEVPGVRIEWRGPEAWAVVEGRYVFGRDGDWQHEPMPSERTDAFKAATRWPSVADAVAGLLRLLGDPRCRRRAGAGLPCRRVASQGLTPPVSLRGAGTNTGPGGPEKEGERR